jgi:hypothetical protein
MGSAEVGPGTKEIGVPPVAVPGSAATAAGSVSSGRSPAEKQGAAAKAVPAKPLVVAPRTESAEDFNLKDHDLFPGLSPPSVPKAQNKESKP